MTNGTLDVNKLNAVLSGILSARQGHKVTVKIEKGGVMHDSQQGSESRTAHSA